jgi:DNA-binding MarR family transcriptional regulator
MSGRTEAQSARDEETASRLRLVVLRLARRLRQENPAGITPSQLSALTIVAHAGPITISDLAGHENVQPPTMSRMVDALERGGWVERMADPTDRRVSLVRATPQAQHELARLRAERNAYLAARLAAVDAADRDAILAALPALERLLDGDR